METPPPLNPVPNASEYDRSWCIGLHLSGLFGILFPFALAHVLAPLVLWLIKRAESPLIDATGKEVLNFQLSFTIYFALAGALCFGSTLLCLVLVGFVLLPVALILSGVLFLIWLVCTIIAAVKTSNGENYLYPMTIRFLR